MEDLFDVTDVGNAIRRRRLQLGVSQEAFADSIDMHRAYYGAIERGQKNMTLATLVRVCNGLGARASAVLEDAGI